MTQNYPRKRAPGKMKSQVVKQIQIQPYENKKAQYPRNNSD